MVQEDGKKKIICKNKKWSLVLGGNLNVYLSSDNTKLSKHYEQ